jgi:hypothetical protein
MVFIIVCVVLGTVIVLNYLHTPAPADAEVLPSGAPVAGITQIHPEEVDITVLVAVSADCRFCTVSMPFYARSAAAAARSRRRVRMVIAADAPVESTKLYIGQFSVRPTGIARLPNGVHLKGTPTLLVISPAGELLAGWFGRLSPRQEEGLLRLLS